ncbi:MAG: DUF4126 domain-containing protein [Anaerolineaceae bacterium]|nr:DUF4126 domain-containing protein [Anaerolineaceae bacterium]
MEILTIFSAFGLSASAGLNAYIPLLIIAFFARFTNVIELSEAWDPLTSWWTIGILLVLSLVEFFADKIPAVNHINDVFQSFIRPAAGAIAFAASANVITEIHPVFSVVLGLLVAGGVHATKSLAVRPTVTASTGGIGNVPVSIIEDITSTILSILAIVVPVLVACILVMMTSFIIWILWRRRNRKRDLVI